MPFIALVYPSKVPPTRRSHAWHVLSLRNSKTTQMNKLKISCINTWLALHVVRSTCSRSIHSCTRVIHVQYCISKEFILALLFWPAIFTHWTQKLHTQQQTLKRITNANAAPRRTPHTTPQTPATCHPNVPRKPSHSSSPFDPQHYKSHLSNQWPQFHCQIASGQNQTTRRHHRTKQLCTTAPAATSPHHLCHHNTTRWRGRPLAQAHHTSLLLLCQSVSVSGVSVCLGQECWQSMSVVVCPLPAVWFVWMLVVPPLCNFFFCLTGGTHSWNWHTHNWRLSSWVARWVASGAPCRNKSDCPTSCTARRIKGGTRRKPHWSTRLCPAKNTTKWEGVGAKKGKRKSDDTTKHFPNVVKVPIFILLR